MTSPVPATVPPKTLSILQKLAEFFEALKTDVENFMAPALAFIENNGGVVALQLATTVLASFEAGAPWATIVAAFITQAEKQGITLAEGAAEAVLNAAQANAAATGTALLINSPSPTS